MKVSSQISYVVLSAITASLLTVQTQAAEVEPLEERLERPVTGLESQLDKRERQWFDAITFGALVEIEASYSDPENDVSSSDLAVATAEVGLQAELSNELSTTVLFLYEEDDTALEVDVAVLSYAPTDTPFTFVVGQDYLPFGAFSTELVNDPLTLEIGESRETALAASITQGLMTGTLYVFNGEQDENGRDTLSNFGGRLALQSDVFSLGVDYISNIADADGLQEEDYGFAAGRDRVAGASVFGELAFDTLRLSAEHLTSLDPLEPGAEDDLSASHVEVSVPVYDVVLAAAYQETEAAAFLELPDERISVGMSRELGQGVALGVELSRDTTELTGDDEDTSNNFVVQLAAEI